MPLPALTSQPERLIVQAFQSDKDMAFAIVYTAYASALRGVLVKMVTDKASAEDLLQDVFLRIWTNLHRYDAKQGRLFTWLLTITRNVARDELNRRYRYRKVSASIQHQLIQEEQVQVPESIGSQLLWATLAPKYRQVLEFICQGYTQEEVARQLRLPLGTVKTRYRTGLQKLKLLFSQDIYHYTRGSRSSCKPV